MLVGCGDGDGAIGEEHASGGNCDPGKTGLRALDRIRPDGGEIDALLLFGFRRLDQHPNRAAMVPTSSLTQFGTAGQHGVGAFRRLDGENVAFHHHGGLPHVEATKC